MPPSPALRYSPVREPRVEIHKRGRSLEGGLLFKEKDDDLALFSEMQIRERENFLLQSSDDFEDTFSTKLKHFSDFKLGISISVRGESSELLNVDGEKNDYDWLLTPPDTPLFRSLDDEPPPVSVASRGRPRSQPISISRSSTMEKSYRSSRGSASPNRSSPSPRSGSSSFQSGGRPSSAPHSSLTHSQRPGNPSRRPSPPPSKASTPAPRSSTPTPRRASTGSGTRGVSPIRTTRGNSASPKIRAWQSNIPGFSSEAPPNLRTSLAVRPASYVRGSSPASRNGRDSSSKSGRQSMSPTASTSVSSSHSHDRDRISSHSRGSAASSGDDADSLQSIHVGSLDLLASKRIGTSANNRAVGFPKKSTKIVSPSSAPKKSFDSALRQMDHRRSPQSMFRPLLSSVPSSTFYIGKGNSANHPFISQNSLVTTSSYTSSDQGTSGAPDTEGSDLHQQDTAIESGKTIHPDAHEEVFDFDKVDTLNKDVDHGTDDSSLHLSVSDFDRIHVTESEPNGSEKFSRREIDMDFCLENTKVCSKCGCRYRAIVMVEKDVNICPDCKRQDSLEAAVRLEATTVAPENSVLLSVDTSEEYKPFDETRSQAAINKSQSQAFDAVEAAVAQQADNVRHGHTSYYERHTPELVEIDEQRIARQHGAGQPTISHGPLYSDSAGQQLLCSNDNQSLKLDVSEGAGICLLLKRSSSSKGPLMQAKTFVASTISYDDFSYSRDSANSFRSSVGHGSTSASSSTDFSSSRQVEIRVQRQVSGKKSDMENYRYDVNTRPQSSGLSLSGNSNHNYHALGLETSIREENSISFVCDKEHDAIEGNVTSHRNFPGSGNKEMVVAAVQEEDLCQQNENNRVMDASFGVQLDENSVASFPSYEDYQSHVNEDDFPDKATDVSDVEASASPHDTPVETEKTMSNTCLDGLNDARVPTHRSLASISEIEADDFCQNARCSDNDDASTNSTSTSDKDMSALVLEHSNSKHLHGILDDSTVMVRKGSKARSLTLEEATDTILFCSSIVHDLAYQAATIAIEKESSVPLEGSRPTVTILGKSTADRKERSRITAKRTSKSQKAKPKKTELDVKSPNKTENDENVDKSMTMVRNIGLPNNMDSTKPPKPESKCNCTIM